MKIKINITTQIIFAFPLHFLMSDADNENRVENVLDQLTWYSWIHLHTEYTDVLSWLNLHFFFLTNFIEKESHITTLKNRQYEICFFKWEHIWKSLFWKLLQRGHFFSLTHISLYIYQISLIENKISTLKPNPACLTSLRYVFIFLWRAFLETSCKQFSFCFLRTPN